MSTGPSFFILTLNAASAGPVASKMATQEIISSIPKSPYRVLRSTKGYKPPMPSKPPQFKSAKVNRHVIFLDKAHERYIPLYPKNTEVPRSQK